eukprot:scaffold108950_cov32-Tisochrysis_lutea.AAC.6
MPTRKGVMGMKCAVAPSPRTPPLRELQSRREPRRAGGIRCMSPEVAGRWAQRRRRRRPQRSAQACLQSRDAMDGLTARPGGSRCARATRRRRGARRA